MGIDEHHRARKRGLVIGGECLPALVTALSSGKLGAPEERCSIGEDIDRGADGYTRGAIRIVSPPCFGLVASRHLQ